MNKYFATLSLDGEVLLASMEIERGNTVSDKVAESLRNSGWKEIEKCVFDLLRQQDTTIALPYQMEAEHA